jgi:hypothetical protein
VVDGEGVGGEAPEVVVGLVQGRMRVNGYEVLPNIDLLFVFGSHWNERAKTKKVSMRT